MSDGGEGSSGEARTVKKFLVAMGEDICGSGGGSSGRSERGEWGMSGLGRFKGSLYTFGCPAGAEVAMKFLRSSGAWRSS
jgi:hypothetical protein